MKTALVLGAVGAAALRLREEATATAGANPIRRVVNLLEDMKKEVTVEGEKEAELYQKFKCYCKSNDGQLAEDAKKAQTTIESNTASAEQKTGLKQQTATELKQHKVDRVDAQGALKQATALRKKEHAAYVAVSGDTRQYIDAVKKAIGALEKGRAAAFLQSPAANFLKNLVNAQALEKIEAADRVAVTAFLSNGNDYAPQGGEIIGILKNMYDEFNASLNGIVASEDTALANYKALKAAKLKEIAAATSGIESKTELTGKLSVEIVQHNAAAEAALTELGDAQAFLVQLKGMCADKAADWESRSKERMDELAAITEAITVLNDDDALDIFKSSLSLSQKPKAFLQLAGRARAPKSAVQRVTKFLTREFHRPALALMANTALSKLRSGVDFSKIVVMIDNMVELLKKEQVDEEAQLGWCEEELRGADGEKTSTENKIASLESSIGELEDAIKNNQSFAEKKEGEIAELDKSVADAKAQRSQENKDYDEMVSLNTSAIQLIEKAMNKLNKFYNPGQYKAPEERELTEEERLLRGAGVDIGDVTAKKPIIGTDQYTTIMAQLKQKKPALDAAPETYGEFKSKDKKSNSVIALLKKLQGDLESEVQSADHEEKTAQRDFENLLTSASASRAGCVKALAETRTTIASEEENLGTAKSSHGAQNDQHGEIVAQIAELHGQCDFLIANFGGRKDARTTEIEGLVTAKSILKGANYQF